MGNDTARVSEYYDGQIEDVS
ncbi:MAG: hypothetical protein HW413_2818, partial [Thermoleophilia bacterium]|nr:hypothetical protein [Thermoleophilia bacterium]